MNYRRITTAMTRFSLLLCSLLFAVSVKAERSDLDNRDLGQLLCRCEAPGEILYPRRLDQEAEVDNENSENRQLSTVLSNGYYMVDGIRVLPASNTACSSGSFRHRQMHQSLIHITEEDKEELELELQQMDENEAFVKPDKMRKLPYNTGYGYGYNGYNGYGYSKGSKSVR
jgi:hypothetical protein